MKKVYIVSPTHIATGGTELLQQLCYILNKNNIDAAMYYIEPYENSPVEDRFCEYANSYVTKLEDNKDNVLVIPETHVDIAKKYILSEKFFWWLSVDNYYGSGREQFDFIHTLYHNIKDKNNSKLFHCSKHLVQSRYAMDYLLNEKGIERNDISYLSDYLNKEFLSSVVSEKCNKLNRVLYNPRKGFEFTSKIIKAAPDIEWIPLKGFTKEKMHEILNTSKVYIDFGSHPGKDRIPREAAVSGCCIITGKRGAASNNEDICIPKDYKFEDNKNNIQSIICKIHDCLDNYEERTYDFKNYRERILSEEESFNDDAVKIFEFVKEM